MIIDLSFIGNMGKGVYIENKVNIQTLDNTELMMRIESDIEGPKAEMCVDLNGFQVNMHFYIYIHVYECLSPYIYIYLLFFEYIYCD